MGASLLSLDEATRNPPPTKAAVPEITTGKVKKLDPKFKPDNSAAAVEIKISLPMTATSAEARETTSPDESVISTDPSSSILIEPKSLTLLASL